MTGLEFFLTSFIKLRAGPRRSEDGGALTAEGMYRAAYAARGGEYERGFSSYKGSGSPSHLIREGQLPVSGKRMCTVLVNHLCISLPRKCGYVN